MSKEATPTGPVFSTDHCGAKSAEFGNTRPEQHQTCQRGERRPATVRCRLGSVAGTGFFCHARAGRTSGPDGPLPICRWQARATPIDNLKKRTNRQIRPPRIRLRTTLQYSPHGCHSLNASLTGHPSLDFLNVGPRVRNARSELEVAHEACPHRRHRI